MLELRNVLNIKEFSEKLTVKIDKLVFGKFWGTLCFRKIKLRPPLLPRIFFLRGTKEAGANF
jgi:hypothetical protein